MDLFELHYIDGRPVMFERNTVLLIEPHVSGSGTFLRLGPIERPTEIHVREEYDFVKTEVTMSAMDRGIRSFLERRQATEPESA